MSLGVAGARSTGAVSGCKGSDRACSGVGACGAESAGDISGGWGGLEVDLVAGRFRDDGVEGKGGEKQLSICRICLFLANTAARLLPRVASL